MSLGLAVVEDDARYRRSLERLLGGRRDCRLDGVFPSGEAMLLAAHEILETGRRPSWAVVLMDLELPGLSGIETTRKLKDLLPEVRVVILTVFEAPAVVLEAICAGADGYLLKSSPPEEILQQVREVSSGGAPLTAGVARTLLEIVRAHTPARARWSAETGPRRLDLSEREQEVLRALVDGLSYKQVAARLEISIDTVRTHVRHVYDKLQVHNVAEAVAKALREGLV